VSAPAAGFPPGCEVLELHLVELKQLFHAIDAAPFRERDLEPRAEEFIVEWARELPSDAPLGLRVRLDRRSPGGDDAAVLQQAVPEFFRDRALATRRQLRDLLRTGRISLVIGLAFYALVLVVGDLLTGLRYGILPETLVIGGWVALWRPLEIFLYDWWPIRAETLLYERLAAMPVQVEGGMDDGAGA
jgi:hypothetical protein